jgi:hypothetical protein
MTPSESKGLTMLLLEDEHRSYPNSLNTASSNIDSVTLHSLNEKTSVLSIERKKGSISVSAKWYHGSIGNPHTRAPFRASSE